MKSKTYLLLALFIAFASLTLIAQESRPFKAGAARIDITPAPDALPKVGYPRGIRDHLYVRALVLDNGLSSAAFISVDIDGIGAALLPQIEKVTGIPAKNIIISPIHTHSSIQMPRGNDPNADPNRIAFAANLEKSIVEVVRQAKANMQPARVGYKTGTSELNVNRNVIDPVTRLWTQAPNYEGPSDKTVAVITYETLDGKPIAVHYNYGMHSNSLYMSGRLSADVPGETTKYIETYYNDKIVALYSPGAQGDQNPKYLQPMQDIEKQKSELALSSGRAKNSEEANKLAGFQGIVDDIDNLDPKLYERQSQMIASMGQFMGEEILRVMKYTLRYKSDISIFSSDTTIVCPGRTRTNFNREGSPATYTDGDPVKMGLKLLEIGDIAFAVMGGDPFTKIAMDLKEESPYNFTVFVAMSNGFGGGYIPTDDAFGMYTFQVLGSKLQPGCAERSIINGFLDLMDKARK